jgi:hypothetical protein
MIEPAWCGAWRFVVTAALLGGALGCHTREASGTQLEQATEAPDASCQFATFEDVDYWACANARTFEDARARCQAVDMDLAVIESAAEDAFVLALLGQHSFIGGRKTTGTMSWRWVGYDAEFWTGAHDGAAVGDAYANWESGHPSGLEAFQLACTVKKHTAPAAGGKWLSARCDQPRPYVCKDLDRCPLNPDKLLPGQCGCAAPDTDTDGDGAADCVDGCPLDPTKQLPGTCGCGVADVDSDGDGFLDCEDGCPFDPTNAECEELDDLPPPLPVPHIPGASPIPQDPVDPDDCEPEAGALEPLGEGVTEPTAMQVQAMLDSVPDPLPDPVIDACGRVQDPGTCPLGALLTTSFACASDAECTGGFGPDYRCRYGRPTVCLFGGGTAQLCSTKTLRCGIPQADCVADPPPPDCTDVICPCVETDVCSLPGAYGDSSPTPDSDLTEETIPESADLAAKKRTDDPSTAYDDPISDPSCASSLSGHCWCQLQVPQVPRVEELHGKQSKHGGGSILQFEFKPDLKFEVDAKARPFGEANFDLDARAMFFAGVRVELLSISESAALVDILASARADRCRIRTSDTQFKVLGIDFVDVLGIPLFDSDDALPGLGEDCREAFAAFEDFGDRAKKALRDAQVLVEAYRSLPEGVGFTAAQFCAQVGSSLDLDFPPGDCLSELAEQTINRYIAYYNKRIDDLRAQILALQQKSVALLDGLTSVSPGSAIPFLDISRSEGETIANLTFFVGPIPMSLEAEVLLRYGIRGDLVYSFTPARVLSLPPGAQTRVASAAAKLLPNASAGLSLFVGAGFSVPGFSVKAGLEGLITLARIGANLEGGVGLSVGVEDDERDLPVDLAAIGTGELKLPLRSYRLFADWFIGARAGLTEILAGTINARLKIKVLFFSKSWRKTVASFASPFGPFELELLRGGDRLGGKVLPVPGLPKNSLGLFEMQVPFIEIPPLPIPTAPPEATQDIVIDPKIGQLGFAGFCDLQPVP